MVINLYLWFFLFVCEVRFFAERECWARRFLRYWVQTAQRNSSDWVSIWQLEQRTVMLRYAWLPTVHTCIGMIDRKATDFACSSHDTKIRPFVFVLPAAHGKDRFWIIPVIIMFCKVAVIRERSEGSNRWYAVTKLIVSHGVSICLGFHRTSAYEVMRESGLQLPTRRTLND